jgi:hypothetical protein
VEVGMRGGEAYLALWEDVVGRRQEGSEGWGHGGRTVGREGCLSSSCLYFMLCYIILELDKGRLARHSCETYKSVMSENALVPVL